MSGGAEPGRISNKCTVLTLPEIDEQPPLNGPAEEESQDGVFPRQHSFQQLVLPQSDSSWLISLQIIRERRGLRINESSEFLFVSGPKS